MPGQRDLVRVDPDQHLLSAFSMVRGRVHCRQAGAHHWRMGWGKYRRQPLGCRAAPGLSLRPDKLAFTAKVVYYAAGNHHHFSPS